MSKARFAAAAIAAVLVFAARAQSITATIDAGKTGEPITKYMYGQFIEHLGDPITKGLWAEMIDDRKFFFPVNSGTSDPPPPLGQTPARGNRRNRWKPIGADAFVTMDREHPYVGDQTPLIKLEAGTPHGILQGGLALRKGKSYLGRVVMAGDSGAKVSVSLVWGPNAADRQTISIGTLKTAYAKFPLQFSAPENSDDARMEIAGTGTGSFHIGAVSLMPGDNVKGFRPDTIGLLKQLDSGMYRLPGGNFLSDHDWEDAIGDPDKRPPTWDYHWGAMQPNDVGTDEFMVFCEWIGVEPYISVNAGFGDARSAANQVEYSNGAADTPYGKMRAANGHPAPYKVKYWNIGNEAYGWWQLGHMALNQYSMKHNIMTKAMRKKDPSITIIASGAMPDEMTVTTNARRTTGNVLAEFGTESDWTGGLLAHSLDFFDALAEHWYTHAGMRFDLETGQHGTLGTRAGFIPVEEGFIDFARRGANRVRCKAEEWDEYLKRFPAIKEKKIWVAMDEWSSGAGPGIRTNLSTAWVFHEMFRHTDFMKMSAHTMGYNCILYNRTESQFNSTGLIFKFYREHYGTIPVEVTGTSPQPKPKWPVGGDQPKVNAGSETYPLDVAAAWSADHKTLTVAVLNPDDAAHELNVSFKGVEFSGKGKLWRMISPDPRATDAIGRKPAVDVAETALSEVPKSMPVPPMSISLYELAVK
jgi:alpha-L-arabinofuranosidase